MAKRAGHQGLGAGDKRERNQMETHREQINLLCKLNVVIEGEEVLDRMLYFMVHSKKQPIKETTTGISILDIF